MRARFLVLKTVALTLALLVAGISLSQQRGGTATVLLSEDLATMNPYLTTALITLQLTPAVLEPLVGVDPGGQYYPILAREVPTVENGGVSEDGLLVTWRLREGVTWSDGEPFTADDVVFTYEAASHAENSSVRAGAFASVEEIRAVDDHTVTVRYETFNSSYLDQF